MAQAAPLSPMSGRADGSSLSSPSVATPVVFVIDDDLSVRQSLESLIDAAGWRPETFASAMEFLARPRPLSPSCLVLDLLLPDLNGLELQERIADRAEMPIILITGHGDVAMTVRAMKAGAIEFLTKPFRGDVLLAAIRDGLERSRIVLGDQAELRLLHERQAMLTRRECEVMALVVAGRLNKQVAIELGISEATVKAHRGKVMQKMRAHSLPDLVNMATSLGLESPLKHPRDALTRADYATRVYRAILPFSPDRQANRLSFSALR